MCCSEKPSPRDKQYREWIWITYLCSIEYDVLLRILGLSIHHNAACHLACLLCAICTIRETAASRRDPTPASREATLCLPGPLYFDLALSSSIFSLFSAFHAPPAGGVG